MKNLISLIAFVCLAGMAVSGPTLHASGPVPPPYPTAAPLDQYLTPAKDAEIALARSAAPPSIANAAEVLVLTRDGYTTAVKGSNGFVCLLERSWGKDTGDAEFWNPKVRAPLCVNAPAAKTYLPIVLFKTKLVLAGKSKAEIAHALQSAWASKQLQPLEPNAICYMMSKQQYLSDDDTHWHPHIMWFVPGDAVATWGAKGDDVPVYVANVPEDRMTIFMIPVSQWSDGTPAMAMH